MKRKKIKSNQALALFLCGLLLLCSIGLVLARAGKSGDEYTCKDLTLTQFQSEYDPMSGITYDKKKYVLSVNDWGGFDINTPGTYEVAYQLTPIVQTPATLPLPELSGGSDAPAVSGGTAEPAKPGGDTPDVKPEPAKPDTDTPAVKPNTDAPAVKPAPIKPDGDTPAVKPEPAKPDKDTPAVKPDTDAPAVKPVPIKPDGDTPVVKPEPAKPDKDAPAVKPTPIKPDMDAPAAKPEPAKPDKDTPAAKPDANAKSDTSTKSDQDISAAQSLSYRPNSGTMFASLNPPVGNSGYGPGSGRSAFTLASNGQDSSKDSGASADSQAAGDQSGSGSTTPADSQAAGSQSGSDSTTPADSQAAGSQNGSDSTTPADSQHTGEQSDSGSDSAASTDGQHIGDHSGSANDQAASGSSSSGGAAADHTAPLTPITFTRNIIVEPAVTYDNLRIDVNSSKADLLTGITYDPKQFTVTVQKDQNGNEEDGRFSVSKIDEYKVTYDLNRIGDGQQPGEKLSEFQRYVWVTSPGVTFDAPPLSVDPSKDYDLLKDITYDSGKYELSLVDPNIVKTTQAGIQRIMYRLTPKSGSNGSEVTEGAILSDGSSSDASGVTDAHTYALAAAIFGRDVTFGDQAFIKWDAPPLVITQGAMESVNLLDGVTATNEKGEPVKVAVKDRSQIDKAIGAAESAGVSNTGKNSVTEKAATRNAGDFAPLILPPQEKDRLGAAAVSGGLKSVPSDQNKENQTSALGFSPNTTDRIPSANAPSNTTDKIPSANALSSTTDQIPSADASSGAVGQTPSASPSSNTSDKTPSAVTSPGAADQTPPSVASSGAMDPAPSHDIALGESAILTPDMLAALALQPGGKYNITMIAIDPNTGAKSTMVRSVEVRALSNGIVTLKLAHNDGAPGKPVEGIRTMQQAFDYVNTQYTTGAIKPTAADHYNYFVIVPAQYAFSAKDQDSLLKLKLNNPYITIHIQGTVPHSNYGELWLPSQMTFPQVPDSTQYADFVLDDIYIKPTVTGDLYFNAQGSKLTMGTKVVLFANGGGSTFYKVVGGSFKASPVSLNTDVTVFEPTYRPEYGDKGYSYICGGNFGADTDGTTHVTVDGLHIAGQTSLYGGSGSGNQRGDSHLTIRGTSEIETAYGGASGQQLSGITYVNVEGGHVSSNLYGGSGDLQLGGGSIVTVSGGSVTTLYGGGKTQVGDASHNCQTSVTVSGGSVTNLYGGTTNRANFFGTVYISLTGGHVTYMRSSSNLSNTMDAQIVLKGNQPDGQPGGQLDKLVMPSGLDQNTTGRIDINVSGTMNIQGLDWFNSLTLADNANVTVQNSIQNTKSGFGIMDGKVIFGANSTLRLESHKTGWSFDQNQLGSFETKGSGAALELYRDIKVGNGTLVVFTPNESDMQTLAANPLTLRFIGPDADSATTGNPLFVYGQSGQIGTGNASLAAHPEWFKGDFPRGLNVAGDPKSGIISIGGGNVGLQLGDDTAPVTAYGSVALALDAIGDHTGSYVVSVREPGYRLTLDDGKAITYQGTNASNITYTSRFVATQYDQLLGNEKVGDRVGPRVVNVGDDLSLQGLPFAPDISFQSNTVIKDITLEYTIAGCSIYANGHTLNVGDGVTVRSSANYFPTLYGGSDTDTVFSTNITVNSGKFNGIYGGGNTGKVLQNTNITVHGGDLNGALYGGGNAGAVGGGATVFIDGGNLTAATPQSGENLVVGGGKTGEVTGACNVTITGGNASGKTTVAGCDQAAVGSVNIAITKYVAEGSISVPAAFIYGGGLNGGTVKGTASITLNSGVDYATISGGGNPSYVWPPGKSSFDSVAGNKTVTLSGSTFDAYNVINFNTLNVGQGSSKTNLTVKGALDSNYGETDFAKRVGKLELYGGSVINFTGTPTATKSAPVLAVGGLESHMATAHASHLHISKYQYTEGGQTKTATNPLHISDGGNASPVGNQIVLGILQGGLDPARAGGNGDKLLVFTAAGAAKPDQYLADAPSLQITVDSTKKVVQFAQRQYPQAVMDQVTPQGADLIGSASSGQEPVVVKQLHFLFTSNLDASGNGEYSNHPVESAYVTTDPIPDAVWVNGGSVPTTAGKNITEIPISQPGTGTDGTPLWSCNVTVSIPSGSQPVQYFAHVRTDDNSVHTITFDVNPPELKSSPDIQASGEGNYRFTVEIHDQGFDPIVAGPPGPDQKPISYTSSGLYQIGWCVGPLSGPSSSALQEALKPTMSAAGGILGVADIAEGDKWGWPTMTFGVSSADFGLLPGSGSDQLKDKVVYLFIKDHVGNVAQVAIPMSTSRIDVTLPSRIGIIALKDSKATQPEVIAPVCYVQNNGESRVSADIVGVDINAPSSGNIQFTAKTTGFAANEMNPYLKSVMKAGGVNSFENSIFSIDSAHVLNLGVMQPKSLAEGVPYVDFTFSAQFDQKNMIYTSDWSTFVLNYRFSVLPTEPAPGPASKSASDAASGPDSSLAVKSALTETPGSASGSAVK